MTPLESLLQFIVDTWLLIVLVAVGIFVVVGVYMAWLRRVRARAAKAWLEVYEIFLKRADKIPLLIELARAEMPEYEPLYQELIAARAATAGMFLPSSQKHAAEKNLAETLDRVLHEITAHHAHKNSAQLLALLHEFTQWESELQLSLAAYKRSLRLYDTFGSLPEGYQDFNYSDQPQS